jgi:hypothetical protein
MGSSVVRSLTTKPFMQAVLKDGLTRNVQRFGYTGGPDLTTLDLFFWGPGKELYLHCKIFEISLF